MFLRSNDVLAWRLTLSGPRISATVSRYHMSVVLQVNLNTGKYGSTIISFFDALGPYLFPYLVTVGRTRQAATDPSRNGDGLALPCPCGSSIVFGCGAFSRTRLETSVGSSTIDPLPQAVPFPLPLLLNRSLFCGSLSSSSLS